MRKMALEECNKCGGPIQLSNGHKVCILCLGRTHTEMALDRPIHCQHFEEMTIGVLRMRLFVLLGAVSAARLLPHRRQAVGQKASTGAEAL